MAGNPPNPPRVLDRKVLSSAMTALIVLTIAASLIAWAAADSWYAAALMAVGIVLIVGSALGAILELASDYKVEPAPADQARWFGIPIPEFITAISTAPKWIAMMALGTLLLLGASFYDGYDGFGIEVSTLKDKTEEAKEEEVKRQHTVTAENQASASAVEERNRSTTLTATAEERTFQRDLQLLSLGVIPEGYTVGSPIAVLATPTP